MTQSNGPNFGKCKWKRVFRSVPVILQDCNFQQFILVYAGKHSFWNLSGFGVLIMNYCSICIARVSKMGNLRLLPKAAVRCSPAIKERSPLGSPIVSTAKSPAEPSTENVLLSRHPFVDKPIETNPARAIVVIVSCASWVSDVNRTPSPLSFLFIFSLLYEVRSIKSAVSFHFPIFRALIC